MRPSVPLIIAFGTVLASAALSPAVLAQNAARGRAAAPAGPRELGKFEDWTAATHTESGQTVCYAFTYAAHSAPAVPNRDKVVLTVTQRPTGRDAVAISAGFSYPANAEVNVQVDQTALSFYTSQRSAFARESAQAVSAFQRGSRAIARSPGPRNVPVADTFSLRGFSAAYAATVKACPPAR